MMETARWANNTKELHQAMPKSWSIGMPQRSLWAYYAPWATVTAMHTRKCRKMSLWSYMQKMGAWCKAPSEKSNRRTHFYAQHLQLSIPIELKLPTGSVHYFLCKAGAPRETCTETGGRKVPCQASTEGGDTKSLRASLLCLQKQDGWKYLAEQAPMAVIQEVFEPPFFANAETYPQDHRYGIPDNNDHAHPPVQDKHNSSCIADAFLGWQQYP